MQVGFWYWVGFNAFILAMLALDLGVFHRNAHAVNERARHEPKSSSRLGHVHGAGCGCGKPGKATAVAPDGKKWFPTKRPWMISH